MKSGFMTFKFLVISLVIYTKLIAQPMNCGLKYFDSLYLVTDPNYSSRKNAHDLTIQNVINSQRLDSLSARATDLELGVFTIPVVFHRIGNGAVFNPNVNGLNIQYILNEINSIFRRISGTIGTGPGVDTEIQFCLATRDPQAQQTNGIIDFTDPPGAPLGPFCKSDDATIKSYQHWDPDSYLNIWICDLSGCSEKAWGSPPAMYYSTLNSKYRDGVVCDANTFMGLNNAKLLAHEIAHWLSLKHTYGEDNSTCGNSNDDYCSDTPWCFGTNQANSFCLPKNPQCNPGQNSNNEPRQVENYMDDSDLGCINMFTLQQKIRMQLSISNIRTPLLSSSGCMTAPCINNGIRDGLEMGIDCGGPCAPCPPGPCEVVKFKINGQPTDFGNIINVCDLNNSIILSPDCIGNPKKWQYSRYKKVKLSSPSTDAYSCVANGNKFDCDYAKLFLSVQECDANKNLIGIEHSDWIYLKSVASFSGPIDLHDYLWPLFGFGLSGGHYYRIKIAARFYDSNPWREHNAYIKVFQSNLNIQNTTIQNSEVSDNLTITNSNIPPNLSANFVGSNSIKIYPNTSIGSGHYFIENYNCQQLSAYRTSNSDSLLSIANSHTLNQLYESVDYKSLTINYPNVELPESIPEVNLYPNPNSGEFLISYESVGTLPSSILIYDVYGKSVYEEYHPKAKVTFIDISDYPSGVFIVQTTIQGKPFYHKVIMN